MAEAVVNVVIGQLIVAAKDWMKEEISLVKGVKPMLDNMKMKMLIIQTLLEDAEYQSVKKKIVKLWLEKLQSVSYDMDDILDEWSTRVLILEREDAEAEEDNIPLLSSSISSSSSSPSSSSSSYTCFSIERFSCFSYVKRFPWRREIAKRIQHINERIELVYLEMKDFELASKAVGHDDLNKIINHSNISRTTTSKVDESKVYGRDDDKKDLLSKVLLMNTKQEKSPQVISIVGAGGLGKTTLAQTVYNDEKVKEKFGEKRIWVCVSNPFDEFKVARHILEGLKVDHTKMTSLEALHQSVEESLSRHKFFLVLDDVWDEEGAKWEELRIRLMSGNPNSKILVTTRKEEVATIMDTKPARILKPRQISDSDCWDLMSQIAFQRRTNKDNDELVEIGKKIAKKCKGLPLAAKTLGSMLKSDDSVDKWKEILNSEIWELEQAKVELFPHIFLSYKELPAMLKRCFLILAIFPKDTELEVERVIAIWMAHGLLNSARTKEDEMVKTGQKYIEFLVSRALLEENDAMISMHNIMHDFALHLSGDEIISIRVRDKIENASGSKSTSEGGSCLKLTNTRHLNIAGDIDPTSIGFDVEKLRTCIMRNVAANVTSDLVKGLKMVRSLYLVHCDLKQVPPSIANLIHLRLLDLSRNQFVVLPETIGGMYNLQQLFLEGSRLMSFPNSMGKLTNLILLKPSYLAMLKVPKSVAKLINLQTLDRVRVESGKSKLELLQDLNQLQGFLEIEFNSDYNDEVDAKKAAIGRKKHIIRLALFFNYRKVADAVIEALQPPSNIQYLSIYRLPKSCDLLPSWITSLDHLIELEVYEGGNVATLPPLGKLRSLKKLRLLEFFALKIIGREFLGLGSQPDTKCSAFPKLVELEFLSCNELAGWEDLKPEEADLIIVMPNLKILKFEDCKKFNDLPRRLLRQASSLTTLLIEKRESFFNFDVELLRIRGVHPKIDW